MTNIDPNNATRLLICFPIIHTQADLGTLGETIKRAKVRKLGQQGWEQQVHFIDQHWNEVERALVSLVAQKTLVYERTRLYQDGLPVCGWEEKIVAELAAAGSRNHQLLAAARQQGAMLMGTESPPLLLAEYKMVKDALQTQNPACAEKSQALLQQRDQFIAARINETLQPGEAGILFIGLLHQVAQWLPRDIQIVYPLQLPLGKINTGKQKKI